MAGRSEPRVAINREFDSFDQFIQEYVTNVSRTGAFIKTKTPLPVGTLVDLRFSVLLEDVELLSGEGEVVRVETDPPGMGVVFRRLTHTSQRLLERLLTAGPPPDGD